MASDLKVRAKNRSMYLLKYQSGAKISLPNTITSQGCRKYASIHFVWGGGEIVMICWATQAGFKKKQNLKLPLNFLNHSPSATA